MDTPNIPPVEIYYKDGCPYCARARKLLQSKGVEPQQYHAAPAVGGDPQLFEEMQSRSGGARTFPQIFIGGQHIGGCDDLHRLEAQGELDTLLQPPKYAPSVSPKAKDTGGCECCGC